MDRKGTEMKKLLTAALALTATPALAHHPLGGLPMETFAEGLLSGVGHPILGFDHLFFVALMGVAALFTARRHAAPAAYIAAMLAGCALMYAGLGLPAKEVMIALSLLVLGGAVLSGRALGGGMALALFAGFGLFHGSAFGDALAAQEGGAGAAVLAGYLLGLGAVQYLMALAAGWLAERLLGATHAAATGPRLAGAAVAGIGLFLTLEAAEAATRAVLFG
jgi:urease accessory protein